MPEDGLFELTLKNFQLQESSFAEPIFSKLFVCSQCLEKLEASGMSAGLSAGAQNDLADLITRIVKEEPALTHLNLQSVSSASAENGTQILAALRASTSYTLTSLNLGGNPAWWNANNDNLVALIRISNNQE